MKISAIFINVFFFCILYWSLDVCASLVYAEDAESSLPDIATQDNHTESKDEAQLISSETIVIAKDVNAVKSGAEIAASIRDVLSDEKDEYVPKDVLFAQTVSQNSGISHELSGSGIDIHTVIDSANLELKERAEFSNIPTTSITKNDTQGNHSQEDTPVVMEPIIKTANNEDLNIKVNLDKSLNDLITDRINNGSEQTERIKIEVPTAEPKSNLTKLEDEVHEDIPSFSEWTQKQLEEAEKKKEQVNSSVNTQQSNGKSGSNVKKRWKNYASPDCGAKIIASNPEAISAGSVLSSSRDEYKLNACTNRIWFIVELCEAIQAKKIDLANFELFSSSPKDFSIFVGDRFPTRDWLSVGQLTAKDERDIQSFDLSPQLFGKYIKFEMHTHHGSEHYCPISLFRVYGTSEFEVLETENEETSETDDDDDDETLDFETGELPKNLFSSATDAVISIVKKAAEVLGNKGNNSVTVKEEKNDTKIINTPLVNSCTTPSHLIICDNCSDLLYGKVYELISCNSKKLSDLLQNTSIIRKSLQNSNVCSKYGFDFQDFTVKTDFCAGYVTSFFSSKFLAALCNFLAIDESKVLLNISNFNNSVPFESNTANDKLFTTVTNKMSTTINVEMVSTLSEDSVVNSLQVTDISEVDLNISDISQIKPTKTLSDEELNLTISPILEDVVEYRQTVNPTISFVENVTNENETKEELEINQVFDNADVEVVTESSETLDEHLDSLVNELNGDNSGASIAATTSAPPNVPQGQKESVFIRLSNRIKALERNISLSSQYLEQLSITYKKQVEEMQRLLDKTIATFHEESKRNEGRIKILEEHIMLLSETVQNLKEERNSWLTIAYWLIMGGSLFVGILLFCHRGADIKQPRDNSKTDGMEIQRRNSVDVINRNDKTEKKRRPSEEAMKASGATCTDLMINESDTSAQKSKDRRRKRKKNTYMSDCSKSLNEENCTVSDINYKTISETGLAFAPTVASSQIIRPPENCPIHIKGDWVGEIVKQNRILDIPFVLEESEHSSLEPLPLLQQISTSEEESVKTNGTAIQALTLSSTENEILKPKKIFQKIKSTSGKNKTTHKKSASLDYGKHFSLEDASQNLNNSLGGVPKKEKKNAFRKIFRTFTFK